MLAKRIIATVLVHNGMVVQSRQFQIRNIIGNVKTVIDFFDKWDADEIIVLDVSREKDPNFLKIVEEGSKKCFVPMAVGGWIRSVDDIRDALNAGADKVVINTEAHRRPEFIREAAEKFGSQCIVVSIDHKEHGETYVNRGVEFANLLRCCIDKVQRNGAGELYITDMDRDGTGKGYNLDILRIATLDVDIPVIVSGGCGSWHHVSEAFDAGADACSIANRLHFSERSIWEAKNYLYERGYPVRVTR